MCKYTYLYYLLKQLNLKNKDMKDEDEDEENMNGKISIVFLLIFLQNSY